MSCVTEMLLVACVLCLLSSAAPLSLADAAEIVDFHNNERRTFGLQPLVWDTALATRADDWLDACDFKHSSRAWRTFVSSGQHQLHGESLAFLSECSRDWPRILGAWLQEKENWRCVENDKKDTNLPVANYTQLIWDSTHSVGCALHCGCKEGKAVFACLYSPAGNRRSERPLPAESCATKKGVLSTLLSVLGV